MQEDEEKLKPSMTPPAPQPVDRDTVDASSLGREKPQGKSVENAVRRWEKAGALLKKPIEMCRLFL